MHDSRASGVNGHDIVAWKIIKRLICASVAVVIIIIVIRRIYQLRLRDNDGRILLNRKPEIQSGDVMGDENVPPGRLSAMGSLRKVSELYSDMQDISLLVSWNKADDTRDV